MPRQRLTIGTFGDISTRKTPAGRYPAPPRPSIALSQKTKTEHSAATVALVFIALSRAAFAQMPWAEAVSPARKTTTAGLPSPTRRPLGINYAKLTPRSGARTGNARAFDLV
jgi:hypothetical protein